VIDGATASFTVAFGQSRRPRVPHTAPLGRVPRVARHLALAHEIERRVRAREFQDLAHAARVFGLTRARVTQISNLLLLAPAIQAEILAMPPVTRGRDTITERTLRPIVAEPMWERQIVAWRAIPGATSVACRRRRANSSTHPPVLASTQSSHFRTPRRYE